MSLDLATVGVEFTSSGGDTVARTFNDVGTAADRATAAYVQNAQAAQQLTASQALIEDAYTGALGASRMAQDAAYRLQLATDAERASFDSLLGPANAAALAHQRLAESAAIAAPAELEL